MILVLFVKSTYADYPAKSLTPFFRQTAIIIRQEVYVDLRG